jgi:EmrB/QacA subfamily drug resistance transporter
MLSLVVAGAFFMQNLDSAIINTSLPQMAMSFGVRPVDLSLGIMAYILSMAAFLPISSFLSDRYGARAVFATAVGVFSLASVACAAATTLTLFAAARIAQGLGAAMMAPVGRALVVRGAQKHEIVGAMAMITWPALLAPVIAPVLGGLITTYWSWRWNFLINAPLGVLAIGFSLMIIPRQDCVARSAFDGQGFVLSAVSLICLLYGLERLSAGDASASASGILLVVGALTSITCVRHLRRSPHPLVELSALSVVTFRASSVGAGFFIRALISAVPFLLPLLFQVGLGASPAAAGVLLMIYFLGNVVMKTATTRLLRRFGFRQILLVNGVLASIAIGLCALLQSASPTAWTCVVLVFAGVTRSMQFTSLTALQFADLSRSQQGPASTLSSILQQVGAALGVGGSAVVLQGVAHVRGTPVIGLMDLRIAFCLLALGGVMAALGYRNLPENAGQDVSGHRYA